MDALLARIDRVRSLARRLVRDAAAADDLVQEALTAALGRPPLPAGDPWRYLTTSLRNLARDRARGARRRAERERLAARPEALGGAAEVAEAAERQRELVTAALELGEPYRTTILLRFFEDLPPRVIAERTGVPVATVKKRLERGLAQLRERLERRFGDRGAWAVALLPVLGTRDGIAPGALGGAVGVGVLTRLVPLLTLITLGGVAALLWSALEPGPGASSGERPRAATAGSRIEAPPRDEAGRALAALPSEPDQDAEQAAQPATPVFAARCVDLAGLPLAGIELGWTAPAWSPLPGAPRTEEHWVHVPDDRRRRLRAVSDAAGRVEFDGLDERDARDGEWNVSGELLLLVHSGLDAEGASVLVFAPAVRVAGRTVDREGRALAGIGVRLEAAVEPLTTFPLRLARGRTRVGAGSVSDAAGRFDLGRIPTHPEWSVKAVRSSHATVSVPMPNRDTANLELVLPEIPERRAPRLHGWVLEADGSATGGVQVDFGQDSTRSDERGRFEIEVSSWNDGSVPTARAEDGRFAIGVAPERQAASQEGGAGPIVLHLPTRMGRIEGRLVDGDGRGRSGVRVLILDPTPFGALNASLEMTRPGRFQDAEVATDREGRFVLERLLERPYSLRFLDPRTFLVHDEPNVRPADGERSFTLPEDGLLTELVGQVVDVHGLPLAGVELALMALTSDGVPRGSRRHEQGPLTTTDTDGRFTFRDAPWRGLELDVRATANSGTTPVRFELDRLDPHTPLRLEVALPCEVHVSFEQDLGASHLRLLDAEGRSLRVLELHPNLRTARERVRRAAHGGFPLFEVEQRAATLVVEREARELGRVPLRLDPRRRNEVRL